MVKSSPGVPPKPRFGPNLDSKGRHRVLNLINERNLRLWSTCSPVPENRVGRRLALCSACGSTHTESGKLYHKVKHRSPPKSFLTPTAKARPVRRRSRRSQERGAPHTEHGLEEFVTRYCSRQGYCGSLSSFYCPHPPAKPTLLQYQLHDHCAVYDSPPHPSVLCHTPNSIGDGNIV